MGWKRGSVIHDRHWYPRECYRCPPRNHNKPNDNESKSIIPNHHLYKSLSNDTLDMSSLNTGDGVHLHSKPNLLQVIFPAPLFPDLASPMESKDLHVIR